MTTTVDIINRALQMIGTRTTVSAVELQAQSSNEAIQANILLNNTRDDLLRMAPWDCATTVVNLTYLTSLPGTPENPTTSGYNGVWAPGLPIPPWVYEYAYPADCLRPLWIVPQAQLSAGQTPIYPVGTSFAAGQSGPPIKYKVAVDRYLPIGAPVDQKVILTNQQAALLMYVRQVTDPNLVDTLFESAWVSGLAAGLAMSLTGDKALVKMLVEMTNKAVEQARVSDGNEDLSVMDSTPDWIRVRGYNADATNLGGFNWGPLWSIG